MMPFMRRTGFIVLAALVAATGVGAQVPRADQARTVFRPDRLVRVRVDARRVEGRVVTVADSQLVLRHGAALDRIAMAEVDTVWVAKRANVRGAAIGAGLVGVSFGVFAVAMVHGLCDSVNGCGEDYVPAFLWVGSVGAAAGAVVGAGVGAFFRRWERAWP